MNVGEAYAACQRLARTHYENFPVASYLLPRRMRPHIAAIYAFARTADDFADEGTLSADMRLARLDEWLLRLKSGPAPGLVEGVPDADAIFVALANTIRERALPVDLFEDLLSAFRQDVTTTRYESWPEVLDYCRRSANPVGRLVLRVAGSASVDLDQASDAVCTALQLTNFWQDFERDWQKGRLYVPLSDMRALGARTEDLERRCLTANWRSVLSLMAGRTRALFDQGRCVCDGVSGRLRFELRMTWLGGRRILDALERDGFDVFANRPALGVGDIPALAWGALVWRASHPAGLAEN
ncbi:MAG: squalene synthase HpnC [Acidobacteria bacterium]|nr:squalene synthase HpnC [Acidobacteriota bacterium]